MSENQILLEALEEAGEEIANLKSLCIRAADALDDWHAGLRAELRKAAK